MLMKRIRVAAAVAAAAGLSLNASAAVITTTFTVQLVVSKTCNVATQTNVDLGTVNAGVAPATASGTFTVTCSKTTPYFIGLAPSNASTTGAGNMNGQAAGNTGTLIPYQLYQNSGATTIWGNTATATTVGNGEGGTGAGMAAPATFTVWAGVAAAATNVAPDTYKDTVTINVNF
jgi:spore coat protein U-like protein